MELKYILNFIYKFLFILKAASNGYIVTYIGGNQFEFNKPHEDTLDENVLDENALDFITECNESLPEFLLKKNE